MSKKNNNLKYAGLGGIVVFTVIVFVLFSGNLGEGLLTGNVAQLSIVSGQGKFSCDAWNEIATVTNGVTRIVESNNQDFNAMFDSSLLSLTSNVDALVFSLVLQCDDNFIEDSRSTTVSGHIRMKICGSGSPEICYVGVDREFSNLQGVATVGSVFHVVPIKTIQIQSDERVTVWTGSIGRSDIEALGKEGGITFTSRMYPVFDFTFDHPTLGVFTGHQDSFASGDLIYSQYGGVTLTTPPPPDSDGDGIPDDVDSCVGQPETVNGFNDEDGCPDVVPDCPDGVVPNSDGTCPDDEQESDELCDVSPNDIFCTADDDGDGVPNIDDLCPDEFGRGEDGCNVVCSPTFEPVCGTDGITYPSQCFALNNDVDFTIGECEVPSNDMDNDGVIDINDICPATLPNTIVDVVGCALPPTDAIFDNDFDGDGIPDDDDDCPASGGNVDQFGCPIDQGASTIIGIFEEIFDMPSTTPTSTTPQTTVTGSPSSPTIIDGLSDTIFFMGLLFGIVIVVVAVLLKTGKVKL